MSKKLKIVLPVLLVLLGGAYKFVLAKPAPVLANPKVEGEVYVLAKPFLINLEGSKFAQMTVGLVIEEEKEEPKEEEEGAPKPPEGFGPMPQEAVVRDVITDELTGETADHLIDEESRAKIKKRVAKALKKHTDVHVEEVLFTDVTIQ